MKSISLLFLLCVSTCFANVRGQKTEVFGTQWQKVSFTRWLVDKDAAITPEVSNLAIQACLRDSQQRLDVEAYDLVNSLVGEMSNSYREGPNSDPSYRFAAGMASLATLLKDLNMIQAKDPAEYRTKCEAVVTKTLSDTQRRADLTPLYLGRLNPKISETLPADYKAQLSRLANKGFRLSALGWKDIRDQICVLEGYYGVSRQSELWKFFSITRAMANVLPRPEDSEAFRAAFTQSPSVVRHLRAIDQYSSIAGKPNGPSIGMTVDEMRNAGIRLTGAALGSNATSLLAFFTTGWREGIQRFVIFQSYPESPFALVPAEKILMSVADTAAERSERISQTEWGMRALWSSWDYDNPEPYDATLAQYRRTASLAWLALNAETNIRQNEKISGYSKGIDQADVTTTVFGTSAQYAMLSKQLETALAAYQNVDPMGKRTPECVGELKTMTFSASHALGNHEGVARLQPDEVRFLAELHIQPVVADIGMEVDDQVGDKPEGLFRLSLATGQGHVVPANIDGRQYKFWTPSAMVLHRNRIMTSAEWRKTEVSKYDSVQ